MRRKSNPKIDIVDLGISLLESFRRVADWSHEELLDYMNRTNNWNILEEDVLLQGLMGADIEDHVAIFGRYLSKDEQNSIISRYNSRFQKG